jgi:hypothetical protein
MVDFYIFLKDAPDEVISIQKNNKQEGKAAEIICRIYKFITYNFFFLLVLFLLFV